MRRLRIEAIEYGDLVGTKTDFTHDDRRRVSTVQTYRGPPTNWTNADYTQQGLLQDLTYAYDEVDNPTEIRDWRIASEWPNGAKPVSRTMEYDDLYRVKRVDYRHHGVDSVDGNRADIWVNPHEADRAGSADPRRSKPAGGVTFTHRMQSEQFSYDWLGNRTFHDDDRHGFWDRSPGPVTHGPTEHGNVKRYRASLASQAGATGGYATIEYDAAGNTKQVLVNRDGPCANGGTDCNLMAWVFCYDEVGQLDRVEHLVAGIGYQSLLTFAYDQAGNRVRKSNVHPNMYPAYYDALYLFDSLELRGTKTTDDEYELTPKTEVAYLNANGVRLARLHYEDDAGVAAIAGESLHVLLQVPDHLGSTSIVIDKNSSELVEAGSYTASGAAETDHRPGKWKHFREDYRWTGKEDDLEAGIQYFGKRFFLPALGRWLTPDPLAVHAPGQADLNLYAYVRGQMLRAIDPTGLQDAGAHEGGTQASPPTAGAAGAPGSRSRIVRGDVYETTITEPAPDGAGGGFPGKTGAEGHAGAVPQPHDPPPTGPFAGEAPPPTGRSEELGQPGLEYAKYWASGRVLGAVGRVAGKVAEKVAPSVVRGVAKLAADKTGSVSEPWAALRRAIVKRYARTSKIPATVQKVNGRFPINAQYAGKMHPSGVWFSAEGYPIFTPHAIVTKQVQGLTGDYATDCALTEAALGWAPGTFAKLQAQHGQKLVWHHVEDGVTMQLIPRAIHDAARHTGGRRG